MQRIRVYVRLSVVGLLVLGVSLVLFKNRGNSVSIWFFWLTDESRRFNVVWLIWATVMGTLMVRWVFFWGIDLWREARSLPVEEPDEQGGKK